MVTNQNDDMKLLADNLWDYFKPMLQDQLEHNIGWFRATVTANPGGGMLTIQRPFDNEFTVKAVSSMRSAKVGDNVLVFTFGNNLGTNAVVMGSADAHNIGGGGGGGSVTAEDVGTGEYEEPLIQIAEGGTGKRTASEAFTALSGWTLDTDTNNTTDTWVPVLIEGNIVQHLVLDDYVLEQGTSGIWTYRKWKSGVSECWGKGTFTDSISTSWGVLYESGSHYWNYPTNLFVEAPVFNVYLTATGGACWVEMTPYNDSGARTPNIYAVRPTTLASATFTARIYAIGRWK